MHKMNAIRSIGCGVTAVATGLEPMPSCPACGAEMHSTPAKSKPQGHSCGICGLLFQDAACSPGDRENMVWHYRAVDPHEKVAASKTGFYLNALRHLDAAVPRRPRRLLDVGCGYGYFLEKAKTLGWEALGVEIVPEAVKSASLRVPGAEVWCGDLKVAALPAASIDAVTLWDVLCHVDDPRAEIRECYRVLNPGGVIGIRVRNLASQLWLCRWFFRLYRLWSRLGIRPLHVFHRCNFTPKAIERLLVSQGFIDIRIQNSPLTAGSPYRYAHSDAVISLGKSMAGAVSEMACRLSHAHWIVGPSLLVWARKP